MLEKLQPWVLNNAHKEIVHIGEHVTISMIQSYYWWIRMAKSVKWWVKRCCQFIARKKAIYTVRWPLVSLPFPSKPGEVTPIDIFGPLPKTERGNEYIMLVVDLRRRYAEPHALLNGEINSLSLS